jgi:diguanylate cyclase (GGDEF)-like protein
VSVISLIRFGGAGSRLFAVRGAIMKILIIDDSAADRALAEFHLADEEYEIVVAHGGAAGLEAVDFEKPDLILLDVRMPDMTGFEVCRRLQESETARMIPVIFLSGTCDVADKIRGLDVGAVDFVSKPFDAFELKARVRAALRTKRLQDVLRDRALIDPLTELYNRRGFNDRLEQEWARSIRYGSVLALVMMDIDNFKRVNDLFGHPAGDSALRQVARRLADTCRQSDAPFRYGGEEFAFILPQSSAASAEDLAQRLRLAVCSKPFTVAGGDLDLTASFGAAGNEGMSDRDGLVTAADAALYLAKAAGKNCVRSATPHCPK